MDISSSSTGVVVASVCILFLLWLGYRAVLPRPIPGIPYNKGASANVLGDLPEMMAYVLRTKRIFCWLALQTTRHRSPIAQVLVKPMSLPWVIVTDPFESQDILLRRTKEFDRSALFGDFIGGILPEQHSQFQSADVRFKNNRNLINQLMAPSFINHVSGPEAYKSVCNLVKLWQAKCRIARGKPFSAHDDITYWALDLVFGTSFGLREEESILFRRLDAVRRHAPSDINDDNINKAVRFPNGIIPDVFSAVLTLANSATNTQLSPMPRLTSWVLHKLPYMRNATAVKDYYISNQVDKAIGDIDDTNNTHQNKSAVHSVLLRERELAAKDARAPDYHKRAIADEFFGFITAGYDTTATTVAWGVKYLADNPAAQDRLRGDLYAALPEAAQQKRAPTYHELVKAQIPYLDAVVQEVLRHANTIAFVSRVALKDTTVLGRHIPKGTEVFLMANGPGYLEPSIPVDDVTRSPGAQRGGKAKALSRAWDDSGISDFRPARWLTIDQITHEEVYDPMAGPQLAFGLGPRGCFGRRLAVLALRIQFAMLIWSFKLLKAPDDLSSPIAVQKFAREPKQCYVYLEPAIA